MQLVELVVVFLVVIEAHHVHGLRDIDRGEISATHRRRDGTRGVEPLDGGGHPARHLVADLRPLEWFLVEHRPHENARVIAVAPDHPFELADVFGRDVEVARFVHDEHSQSVAYVEKLLGWRVVGAADGIDAHFLELAHAELPKGGRHGDADSRVVLMVADALDFQRLVVEIKTRGGIEAQGAESTRCDHAVENTVALFDHGLHRIHGGRIHRPEARVLDLQSCFDRFLAQR